MTSIPNPHTALGATSGKDTVAVLTMHRMRREAELKAIFDALGLDRTKDTAGDAVAMTQELIRFYGEASA